MYSSKYITCIIVPVFYFISVFKIYSIEEDKFEEKLNLRVGKNLNLNFSSTDVAWNHIEGKDSILKFYEEGNITFDC